MKELVIHVVGRGHFGLIIRQFLKNLRSFFQSHFFMWWKNRPPTFLRCKYATKMSLQFKSGSHSGHLSFIECSAAVCF